MDPGWRFTLGDPGGAERPSFDDRRWRELDLPHDWSIEGTPTEDAPGGGRVGFFPAGTNIVELFLNGRSLGEKRLEFPAQGTSGGWNSYAQPVVNATTSDLHLSWDVPYQPGVLRAVGKRRDGTAACESEVRTTGAPAALRLVPDRDTITTGSGDVAHVSFEIVDSAGIVVPTADNTVSVTAAGGNVLVVDNADLQDLDPYRSDRRRAFSGRGLAIVRAEKPGVLRVSASADGLRGASVRLQVIRGAVIETVPAAGGK